MLSDDLNKLGDQLQDIVQDAVDSKNFEQLNQTIRKTLNMSIDVGSQSVKSVMDAYANVARRKVVKNSSAYTRPASQPAIKRTQVPEQIRNELYSPTSGLTTKGVLFTVGGSVVGAMSGLTILAQSLLRSLLYRTGGFHFSLSLVFFAAAMGCLFYGIQQLTRVGRFKKYVRALGDKCYMNIKDLSMKVAKPEKIVRRDLKRMIKDKWFLQGHLDSEETCLISSDEMYEQYRQIERDKVEQRKQEQQEEERQSSIPSAARDVLAKGKQYLSQIKDCNDRILGEDISGKITGIEILTNKIIERAEQHPEVVLDLKKMMDYYLPMTVKLLNAYAEMDSQPVQGENIISSKREIEGSLDTLNIAFERLFDSIFQEQAWDVSTDVSVLQTLLAQDGLAEDQMQDMKALGKELRETV